MSEQRLPTPRPAGYLEVARQSQAVLMRVVGLGNMNISLTMKDFVKSCLDNEYMHFALDLERCTGLDSTFMGTIVAINYRVREKNGWLCLLNVGEDNRKLLKMLGVWGLVRVREEFPVESVETECLMPGGDAARRLKHIRIAHEHLVAVDERNKERFGAFLSGLEEEMQKTDPAETDEQQESPTPQAPAPPDAPHPAKEARPQKKKDPKAETHPRLKTDTQILRHIRNMAHDIPKQDSPPKNSEPDRDSPPPFPCPDE